MRFAYAAAHCLTHVSVAVMLLLMLELGTEVCIRHEHIGQDGAHSLYNWYRKFEAEHFPDPHGMRPRLEAWTLGLYPGALKAGFALFDVPEAIAVARTAMCAASSSGVAKLDAISRPQAWAYYSGMLAYYWLLATPAVALVFGLYLYVSVCWLGCHFDEAFSSLRIPHFKALTRMHVTKAGDLEIYTLAMHKVPTAWREDPRWAGHNGGGGAPAKGVPAHAAKWPSRWLPESTNKLADDESLEMTLIDYVRVARR
mmetsp:Transcript_31178/g.92979  ORF Transcript_31178/g.92979 Transcript_31178/m.92979 type:complete len:255 (-) Transcript_31178:755-1519(-)